MNPWQHEFEHYGWRGAACLYVPHLPRPVLRLTRNGRMLGVWLGLGNLGVDLAVYRPPWRRDVD